MGHNIVVSGHSKSIGISRVDRLSTRPPGFRVSHNPKNHIFTYHRAFIIYPIKLKYNPNATINVKTRINFKFFMKW